MTHTPGPWKFMYGSIYGPDSEEGHDSDDTAHRTRIALMDRGSPDTSPCDRDDNARHIVHCVNTHPAMLEALKEVVEAYEADDSSTEAIDRTHVSIQQARAAIAAAEEG